MIVETTPPFCKVCKQYLTDLSCNNINKVECPYFGKKINEFESKKI